MKISIFTTIGSVGQSPDKRQDAWREALNCYEAFADEVVVVNGTGKKPDGVVSEDGKIRTVYRKWPQSFSWDFIGSQFNYGLEHCTGDWAIRADLDYFFHENTFDKIRDMLEVVDAPAVNFLKWQFMLVDRYNLKSICPIALNRRYPVKFTKDGGAHIAVSGNEINKYSLPNSRIEFFNYDWSFKDKKIVAREMHRFAVARKIYYGKDDGWGAESETKALEYFNTMASARIAKPSQVIPLEKHPRFIQGYLRGLKPSQFGYNGWGEYDNNYYQSLF